MLRRFIRMSEGNVATSFALTLVPLMVVMGLTLDFSRTEGASNNVQSALDGAALAASAEMKRGVDDKKIKTAAKVFFEASINANNVPATCGPLQVEVERSEYTVEASVTCSQPTTVSGLVGLEKIEFTRKSHTTYGVGKLDVVFMFDTSGSMGNQGRMTDLKAAAKDAVDIILASEVEKEGDVRIAISTYATSVNVGETYFKAVTDQEPNHSECTRWQNNNGNGNWKTASYAQKGGNRGNGNGWGQGGNGNGNNGNGWGNGGSKEPKCVEWEKVSDTCVTGREGTEKYTDAAPGNNAWIEYDTLDCNNATITPLTDDGDTLKSRINALPTSGSTAGHLGIVWSWYLISPEWNSIWPEGADPFPYNEPDLTKIAILMTDGEFNKDYMSNGNSFAHAKKYCDAMKASGVVIYTVAFKAPNQGQEILEYCATDPSFAFKASDGQQLSEAYKTIATSISDLRISH